MPKQRLIQNDVDRERQGGRQEDRLGFVPMADRGMPSFESCDNTPGLRHFVETLSLMDRLQGAHYSEQAFGFACMKALYNFAQAESKA